MHSDRMVSLINQLVSKLKDVNRTARRIGGWCRPGTGLDASHRLLQLVDGKYPSPYFELPCPETGRRCATRETDPVEWDPSVANGTGIATYACPHCGDHHDFLWKPSGPTLIEDPERDRR